MPVLGPGQFGMAEETGRELNDAIAGGVRRGLGLGQAVAAYLAERRPPFADVSLLCAAARLGIPVTVHVGIGTDIIHMHPPRPAKRSAPAAFATSGISRRSSRGSRAACTSTAVPP